MFALASQLMHQIDATVVRRSLGISVPEAVALVFLFATAGVVECVRLSSLQNADVWMHLAVGNWILTHQMPPINGILSQAMYSPWRDFSWAGDTVLAGAYRVLGLSALPALWILYRLAVAVITFLVAGGLRGNFAAALSAIAQYLLWGLGPIENGVSVIFFACELMILDDARKSGRGRVWLWLPVLFLAWANLDLGFIYGIVVLLLFVAVRLVEEQWQASKAAVGCGVSGGQLLLVFAASVVASLVSPYTYHSYSDFFAIQAGTANRYLFAHTAMSFHEPRHYVFLLLVMTAFLSAGLRRSRGGFGLSVLVGCTAISFFAQGTSWLGVLASIAVINGGLIDSKPAASMENEPAGLSWRRLAFPALGALGVALLAYGLLVPKKSDQLLARVAEIVPVQACDYIRQHQLPAPMFNEYGWGGFLAWYLPQYPVAIDARRGLYGDETETNYFRVMQVLTRYQDLPSMKNARTLLLSRDSVIGEALQGTQGFRVVYADKIATVLLQERPE